VSGNAGAVLFTLAAGVAGAIQVAVNGTLGKRIGTLEAAAFQTAVGMLLFAAVTLAWRHGFAGVGAAFREPPWLWLGGAMGAVVIGAITFAPTRIGALAVAAVLISGQLAMSAVIDAFGLFGLDRVAVTWPRAAGLVLLGAGCALILER